MKQLTTQDVELLGSDSQLVFGGTWEGGYHLQQIPDEITPCINDIIKSKVKIANFLEIGSAAGGCTYLFDSVFGMSNIVIVDDNQHPKHIHRPKVLKQIRGDVKEFIGDSHSKKAVEFIKKLGMGFDIILIDAGHSFSDVFLDVENYGLFLNSKGFLLFHDVEIFNHVDLVFQKVGKSKEYKIVNKYISKTHPNPCGIGMLQKK